jgi:hypothetical protein
VKIFRKWSNNTKEISLESAMLGSLDPDDCGGAIESLSSRCDAQDRIIAKLVVLLHDRGVLSDDDIADILSHRYEVIS